MPVIAQNAIVSGMNPAMIVVESGIVGNDDSNVDIAALCSAYLRGTIAAVTMSHRGMRVPSRVRSIGQWRAIQTSSGVNTPHEYQSMSRKGAISARFAGRCICCAMTRLLQMLRTASPVHTPNTASTLRGRQESRGWTVVAVIE